MRAKKPLIVLVVTLALLAVALILPAAAFGKTADLNKPVSWVSVGINSNSSGLPDFHGGVTAKVQRLADGPVTDDNVRGQVVIKVFREFWPEFWPLGGALVQFKYVVKSSTFYSPGWWDYFPPGLARADFFTAAEGNWPADLGAAPAGWPYKGAAVADFVVYVPVSQYPESLPWVWLYTHNPDPDLVPPSIPYRFMFIDCGEPGATDLWQSWLFTGVGWEATQFDPAVTPGDPVPIQSGNIQVHVGATDG